MWPSLHAAAAAALLKSKPAQVKYSFSVIKAGPFWLPPALPGVFVILIPVGAGAASCAAYTDEKIPFSPPTTGSGARRFPSVLKGRSVRRRLSPHWPPLAEFFSQWDQVSRDPHGANPLSVQRIVGSLFCSAPPGRGAPTRRPTHPPAESSSAVGNKMVPSRLARLVVSFVQTARACHAKPPNVCRTGSELGSRNAHAPPSVMTMEACSTLTDFTDRC